MLWFLCFSHILDLNSCSSTDHPLVVVATVVELGSRRMFMLVAVAAMYWAAADCRTAADPVKIVMFLIHR